MEFLGQRDRSGEVDPSLPAVRAVLGDIRYFIVVRMIGVEGQLVPYPETDEDGDGHADGKAGNIDDGVDFASRDMAPGDYEIVFQHCISLG